MSVGWETADRSDGVHVQLTGELDISSASGVESRLIEIEQRGPERVFLDLRRVNFIDSTGLSMIINADGRAKKAGRKLTIVSGDGVPRRILRTVGLEDRLDVLTDMPHTGPASAPTTTSLPRLGAKKIARRAISSCASPPAGASRTAWATERRIVVISSTA